MLSTLLLSASLLHPNPAAALPAPVIEQLTNLTVTVPKLEAEYPHGLIFYDGGLAGYFPNPQYWKAPIWTTLATAHVDVEHPLLWHWIRQHRDDCPSPANVPEPGTGILIAAGSMLMALLRRSR